MDSRYRFCFAAALSVAMVISLAGCDQLKQQPAAQDGEKLTDLPMTADQEEAVSFYVDAAMLNDLDERDNAIEKLNLAIELDPEFGMAYSLRGDIYRDIKQYDLSADSYETATELDPWSFGDFFNLGKVYQITDSYLNAVGAYVRACELDAEHYESHLNAARCYYELRDLDRSFEYTQMAKEISPKMGEPDVLLGDIFVAQDEQTLAISAYKRALEIDDGDSKVMVSLAVAYLRLKKFEAANELLLAATEADPDNGMAFQYLGFSYLKLEETDLALRSYGKAIKIDDNGWMAHKGMGVVYILKSIRKDDDSLEGQELEANEQEIASLKDKGIGHWNRSLNIKPDQPNLRALLKKYSK